MAHPSLDALHSLRLVIELGGFTLAADRLGLSQPAVSQQVRQLEAYYGVRLIERVGRTPRATAAGEELLRHIIGIEALLSSATESLAPYGSGERGRVRIGTGASASTYLLPRALKALRQSAPLIDITVSVGSCDRVLGKLEANEVDLAFLTVPSDARAGRFSPLLSEELVLIAPPSMALPAQLTPQAVATLPFIIPESGETRRLIDGWFAAADVPLTSRMAFGSFEAIKELVDAGLGCAIIPQMAVAHTAKALTIRPLSPPLCRTIGLALRPDKVMTKALRATVRALEALAVAPHARHDAPASVSC